MKRSKLPTTGMNGINPDLTKHIDDKWRCLCPKCIENRRIERLRDIEISKEYDNFGKSRGWW